MLRRRVHTGSGSVDDDFLIDSGNREREVELQALADGQRDSGLFLAGEAIVFDSDGIRADRDRRRKESPSCIGYQDAFSAGLGLANGYCSSGDGCTG